MSQNLNDITIDFINPQKSVGDDLRGCYFVYDWSNDTYSFFERGSDKPLRTDLRKGHSFSFRLSYHPDIEWRLHISKHSDSLRVDGKWKENDKKKQNLSRDDWEPEQSYQATAGGGAEGEMNAATATA